ncbi:MAG: GNAT family N-acetyltransferase, partial [Fimbriimonas sp.]
MKDLKIRAATPNDIKDLASLRGGGERLEKTMLAYLQGDYFPSHAMNLRLVLVGTLDGEFAGYTAGHETDRFGCQGELQWLNVKPEFQRQGVGRELVTTLLTWFIEQ